MDAHEVGDGFSESLCKVSMEISLRPTVWFGRRRCIRSADTGVVNPNVGGILQQVRYIKKEEMRC